MQFRTILLGSAAAAVLATAVASLTPSGHNFISPAQAQNASISFSVFYDDLAPHGDWVSYRNAYVFIPANVGPNWRPYTVGRWAHTRDYGWMWVSDEEFGWATYHYGRWGYADEIGWYWVPGTRWAPAWVSWKRSSDHVVWAPLPPSGDDDVFIDVSIGTIPDYYWVAVPTQSFLQINLSIVIIDNDRDRRRIVREARDEGRARVRGNIVVNNFIDVNLIEERTGKKVRNLEVRRSDKPGRARVGEDQVTVFTGNVEPDRDRKPGKLKKLEEVKQIRTREEPADDQATGEPPAGDDQATQPVKKRKANQQATEEQPAEDGQAVKPVKKKANQQATEEQPAEDAQAVKPRKKKANQQAVDEQPADDGKVAQGKKKPARKNGKVACDPATQDCPS